MSSEVVRSDVNDVADVGDDPLLQEAANVNWHAVNEQEAARFGIAVGFYRDATQTLQVCRAAWKTSTGGVLSMATLTVACLAAKAGPWFALGVVVAVQALRTLWLYGKVRDAGKHVELMASQAQETLRNLAIQHPAG